MPSRMTIACVRAAVALATAAVLWPATAAGQVGANVSGTIKDTTGGALPGVTVTITNKNNGAAQTLVSGPDGNYRAVNLQPAPYDIVAELSGFAAMSKTVTLYVGSDVTVDFALGVASLTETLTVSGESPLIEVTKSQPSSVIVGEQLATLPVLDRNFLVLAQLLPGSAPLTNVTTRFAVTKFGGVADQRNGYTTIIDGGTVDDATWGSPVINMTQDAVQEFKVFRNQFDAEFGSALNAVVNVVSKSGGNRYAGTGYYFGRDKDLNATNAKAATKPPFQQSRVGGTFGGPLALNRTHVFAAYEFLDINKAAIVALPGTNPFAAQQNGNYPYTVTEHLFDAKLDHRFNDANSFFVRYAYDNQTTPSGGPDNATSTQTDYSKSHSVILDDNWILSQNKVNNLRVHILHHDLFTLPSNFDLAVVRPSYSFGQNGVDPQFFPRTNISLFDTFYLNTPRHDIKVGGEFTAASSNFEAHFTEHGQFTFLTDTPFDAAAQPTWPFTFVQQTPGFYNYRSKQITAFVQDDWRIVDRVRVNLGLRYDVDTNLRNNAFYESLLANPLYTGVDRFISGGRGNDLDNIQPRVGATWDVRGNGRVVARAGFGRYVTRNRPWFQETSMDKSLGFSVRITDPLLLRNYPDITAVLGGKTISQFVSAGGARSLYLIDNNYQLPYSLTTTAGVGWQLNNVTSVDVDYVHNYATDQLGTTDANLPASGAVTAANPRPVSTFSQVGVLTNYGKSWYNALEVQLRTRVRGTDSLQVSYAYSRSMLDGVTFYSTYRGTERTPQQYGYNPTDTPHNLSVAASTSLPFKFQLSGVFRAISGTPFNVNAGIDLDGDLNTQGDRPRGLPPTVGRGDVAGQLAMINAYRATRGQQPVSADLLKPDPIVVLDARLTKVVPLRDSRRIEVFLEGYNLSNYVTLTGGAANMSLPTFLIRTGARDARQIQWGARYVF
ncbi:MAG TPA: carboxypeptidase regulatory-like domain-containing protein [Vicinamibacterales bacterium]|nr:carboxypeptidase regulatory-like domain-containing protein [Vicinamibacterales bacterium]